MTPELKARIDNNIYVCERHFKADCVLSCRILICINCVICVACVIYTPYIDMIREQGSRYVAYEYAKCNSYQAN